MRPAVGGRSSNVPSRPVGSKSAAEIGFHLFKRPKICYTKFIPVSYTHLISLGGTSILIIVGVALETVRNLESQITMRHHKGFLE